MAEKLPKFAKDVNLQIQETELSPMGYTPRKTMPKYVQSKFWKLKTKYLEKKK